MNPTKAMLRAFLKERGLTVKELASIKVDGKVVASERHLFYCLAGKRRMSAGLWCLIKSLPTDAQPVKRNKQRR